MNIPKRIVGNLELKGEKYSFELDKESFELKLYHSTTEDVCTKFFEAFKTLSLKVRENKWIDRITIQGVTSERYWWDEIL